MRQVDHPNIVKFIDFSEARQYYYIVLELCPGGELFHQIVRLTYFSEDLSRHIILQVAKAIEYLHETSGVVHRYAPLIPWLLYSYIPYARILTCAVISNQKTSSSTPYPSFQANTPNLHNLGMKKKSTKANSHPELGLAGLGRSRLPISVSPRSSGIVRL